MRAVLRALSVVGLVVMLGSPSMQGEIRMPALFSDHMVLQSQSPVTVWGKATPGADLVVSFDGQTVKAKADAEGFWKTELAALKLQSTPGEMTVRESGTGQSERTIHDVLVGEVWLASGQSNMAYPLQSMDGKESYLEKAANPQIRLFAVKLAVAPEPLGLRAGLRQGDVQGRWVVADAKSAASFSAVGMLFAEELQAKLNRPVGMIGSSWGGTPIQSWMSIDILRETPALKVEASNYDQALAKHRQLAADPESDTRFQQIYDAWFRTVGKAQDDAMRAWNAKHDAGADPGPKPVASQPEPKNPDPMGLPRGGDRPHAPSAIFNAMISPLAPYAAKGALWYQGEANVSHWKEYGDLLPAMIADWRTQWGSSAWSFYVVQLPAFGKNQEPRDLPRLREAQARALTLSSTALAVAYDVGDPDNVHPRSKVAIAHRLTLDALGQAYGQKVAYRGPVLTGAKSAGSEIQLHFQDDGGGLTIGQSPWLASHAVQFPKDRLVGFEVAGKDGIYAEATAEIHGDNVVLRAKDVAHPATARYAWNQSPQANLYDVAGLPAAPFRTDEPDTH